MYICIPKYNHSLRRLSYPRRIRPESRQHGEPRRSLQGGVQGPRRCASVSNSGRGRTKAGRATEHLGRGGTTLIIIDWLLLLTDDYGRCAVARSEFVCLCV